VTITPNLDPFDMWRQAVTKLEESMNTLGTQSLKSGEVNGALLQYSQMSTQMQKVMEVMLGKYLKTVNLPSRKEVMELTQTLQRIEDKLDRLMPASEQPQVPRPARTRRPAMVEVAAQAAPELTPPVPPATVSKSRRPVGAGRARKGA